MYTAQRCSLWQRSDWFDFRPNATHKQYRVQMCVTSVQKTYMHIFLIQVLGPKTVLIYASQGFAKRLRVPFKCSAPDRQPNIFDFSNILKQKI